MTNRQCSDWGGGGHLLQKFADPKVNASVAKEHFTKEGAVRSTILELVYLVHNLPIKEILKSEHLSNDPCYNYHDNIHVLSK